MDRFETGQKVLTTAPAGAAALTGPTTAPASPGASRTALIRVFYVVLYPYSAKSRLLSGCYCRGRAVIGGRELFALPPRLAAL